MQIYIHNDLAANKKYRRNKNPDETEKFLFLTRRIKQRRWNMKGINTVVFSIVTVAMACCPHLSAASSPLPGGTLNPSAIPKYVSPLAVPPEMPATGPAGSYDIEVVPHNQQILPLLDNDGNPLSATPVWTYGAVNAPETRNYPAFTIEATKDVNTQVVWRNNLVDANGAFLPHLLPVDRSLHWANPELLPCANGETRTDCRPAEANGLILQQPYSGPVPIITHLHGAHTRPESDGYPEAWYLPAANNIPVGYATTGRLANQFGPDNTGSGAATFNYPNDQNSATLWYHDHTLGMTRLNVYAGPAGFYLLRETGGGRRGSSPAPCLGRARGLAPVHSTIWPIARYPSPSRIAHSMSIQPATPASSIRTTGPFSRIRPSSS